MIKSRKRCIVYVTNKYKYKNGGKFEKFCSNVGMTMTTAFCIFAKKVVLEQKIPFEISTDPFYSKENMIRLEKAVKDVEEGKVTRHNI